MAAEPHRSPPALRAASRALSLLIVFAAAGMGVFVWRLSYREPRTDDASVRANVVGIAPHVGGPIVELNVVDNQAVRQGDLLFVIDPRPYEVALESAKAAMLLQQSEVTAIDRSIEGAAAEVVRLEAESAFAADHVKRLQALLANKFVTQDKFEEARSRSRAFDAALAKARQDLGRQRSLLAQYGDENARLAAAKAVVAGAELDLEYTRVHAPFDAVVTNLNITRGEYARVGQQVFALVDTREWYVMANFQETFLDSIRAGMPVDVYLMSYPNQLFHGTVQGIGWAVQPEDGESVGVLPRVRATLNWVRLAQRIPVRIRLEAPAAERPYRMGMTAVVTVRGDEAASGSTAR